jgi:hypothetical protein
MRNLYLEIFGSSNASYHPMIVQNGTLFIGDGCYIHQYENTLTHWALDLPTDYVITTLAKMDIVLLVGTEISSDIAKGTVFNWNTWSESWSIEDEIPEASIQAFIPVDNYVYVMAGNRTNVYFYNGQQLQLFRRVGGEYDRTDKAKVHPNATASLHGIPLIGVSNSSGNPIESGVYGMGTANPSLYPRIFDLEYVLSEGLSDIEIGDITVMGGEVFVSWKKGTDYGVDTFDGDNLHSGSYIQTRVLYNDRNNQNVYRKAIVNYLSVFDNTPQAVTFNVDDTVTLNAHGLQDGEAIVFSSAGVLPAELTAGTTYYVRDVTINTFKVSATEGGSAIDLTDVGTGVHKVALEKIIRLYYRSDYDLEWTELDLTHDLENKQFYTESFGESAFCIEFKLEMRAWKDEGVIVDQITFYPQENV